MGRKSKVTKKDVGSANGSTARGEEADGSTKEFAAAGMGLQELPAAAAEGSDGKSMVSGDVGPPTLGTLADGGSQPSVVVPSSEREVVKSEPAAPVLILKRQGAATRAGFKEHATGKKWMAEGDAAQPTAGCRTGAVRQREQAGRRRQASVLGPGCLTQCTPPPRVTCRW